MTFAIPPAQLKYARRLAPDKHEDEMLTNEETGTAIAGGKHSESSDVEHNDVEDVRAKRDSADDIEIKNNTAEDIKVMSNSAEDIKVMGDNAEDEKVMISHTEDDNHENDKTQAKSSDPHNVEDKRVTPRPCDAVVPSMANPSPAPSSQLSAIPSDIDDVILASITTLQALEDKIVTIDGRLGKKVDGNAFKSIRVKRNNQDLGTLFEIREEWYVYKK